MRTLLFACAASAALAAAPLAHAACFTGASRLVAPVFNPDNLRPGDQTATVSYHVDANGWTKDIRIVDSSGDPNFERAAIDAVRQWSWQQAPCPVAPVVGGAGVAPIAQAGPVAVDLSGERMVRMTFLPDPGLDMMAVINPVLGPVTVAAGELGPGSLAPSREDLIRATRAQGSEYGIALSRGSSPYPDRPFLVLPEGR